MRYTAALELNLIALLAILSMVSGAYVFEFWFKELPCPLCLLQRLGLLMIGFGFLLNLKFGVKMEHYGLSLLGTIYTSAVAMRQIVLHILPSCHTYGPEVFNLHLYTWSFIAASLVSIFIAFELAFDPFLERIETPKTLWIEKITAVTFAFAIGLSLTNALTSLLICGSGPCPEDPKHYKFITGHKV